MDVALPLASPAAAAADEGDPITEAVGEACVKGCTVLVMDDDQEYLTLLGRALKERGVCMVATASLNAALQELATDRFHLVLADVRMPDGGAADLLALLDPAQEMPQVVAMSGVAPSALREKLLSLGAADCIEKPRSLAEMVRIIEERLAGCPCTMQVAKRSPAEQADRDAGTRARVLLAEDEDDIRRALALSLAKTSCSVVEVNSAADALKALEDGRFDLIISDVLMPGGGARSILQALADHSYRPPVVVITGKQEQRAMDELRAAGAATCVQKPFELRRLMDVVEELLSLR